MLQSFHSGETQQLTRACNKTGGVQEREQRHLAASWSRIAAATFACSPLAAAVASSPFCSRSRAHSAPSLATRSDRAPTLSSSCKGSRNRC